jgi:hypothetical protein
MIHMLTGKPLISIAGEELTVGDIAAGTFTWAAVTCPACLVIHENRESGGAPLAAIAAAALAEARFYTEKAEQAVQRAALAQRQAAQEAFPVLRVGPEPSQGRSAVPFATPALLARLRKVELPAVCEIPACGCSGSVHS